MAAVDTLRAQSNVRVSQSLSTMLKQWASVYLSLASLGGDAAFVDQKVKLT
jgi:hypothetical protein